MIVFTFIDNDPIPTGIVELSKGESDQVEYNEHFPAWTKEGQWPDWLIEKFVEVLGNCPCTVNKEPFMNWRD